MSVRLEEQPFEIDGRVYILRCNMAVLDRLEIAHGSFEAVMQLPPRDGMAEFLAAMLNDYAEDMGWEQDWTAKRVKKRVSFGELLEADILGLVNRAVVPASLAAEQPEPGENPGN